MKNKKVGLILIIAALVVFVSYQYQKSLHTPIHIGFVSALSGSSADLGFSSRNAFEMYIAEINSSGGINGHPIELTILDDQGDPDIALALFEQLIASDIKLIVGQVTSSSATLTVPYINRQDALFISPLVSSNSYRGGEDNFIALAPSASDQGVAIADYIISKRGSGNVAIIYDNSNLIYSRSVFEGAIEQLSKNDHFNFQLYPLNQSSEISNIIDSTSKFNPDDFIVITSVSDLILISNQVKKASGDKNIYSSMWGMAPEVISGFGESMSNVYGIYAIDPNFGAESFLTFKEQYREKFKVEANFGAIYAYDAARLLVEAIQSTNSTDPSEIKAYIIGTQFYDGVNTPYEITRTGDAIRNMSIIHAEDGQTMD